MLTNTSSAQAYILRFLSMLWFKRIKESKDSLDNHIENINDMIKKFNSNATQFKQQFPDNKTTKPLNYLEDFE